MVDRLIIVKNCAECPMRQMDLKGSIVCGKRAGSYLGEYIEDLKKSPIPVWCPLTYAKPKGFGPVPNKHEIHDTR